MAKQPGAPSGGDLPHGEGTPPNTPVFEPIVKVKTLVGKILKDHPIFVGCIIVGIFVLAIVGGCPVS